MHADQGFGNREGGDGRRGRRRGRGGGVERKYIKNASVWGNVFGDNASYWKICVAARLVSPLAAKRSAKRCTRSKEQRTPRVMPLSSSWFTIKSVRWTIRSGRTLSRSVEAVVASMSKLRRFDRKSWLLPCKHRCYTCAIRIFIARVFSPVRAEDA